MRTEKCDRGRKSPAQTKLDYRFHLVTDLFSTRPAMTRETTMLFKTAKTNAIFAKNTVRHGAILPVTMPTLLPVPFIKPIKWV